MFLLIPAIIIFLLLSYIYLNQPSVVTQGIIYLFIFLIIYVSLKLYRKIKKDLKLQEINALESELLALKKRLQNTEDEIQKNTLQRKINALENEIQSKTL